MGVQAGHWKINQFINLFPVQSLHFLQAQGSQTFKNPLHLKAKTAYLLRNTTSLHGLEFKCSKKSKSLGVCKLNQVFSDLALAVMLLRSGKGSQRNPHVREL